MTINGTKHDDDLTGTDGNDDFHLQKGGTDTASGGKGDDLFRMGATLDGSDRIDGGEGRDTVFLHGDYSAGLFFQDDTIKNVEVLRLGAGFSYTLGMSEGNVAAGETLTIDASPLDSAHSLSFNGSEEHDGHFVVYAGAGDDNVTGGTQADKIHLEQGGNDTVHGGSGDDILYFGTQLFAADQVFGDAGVDTLVYGGTFGAAPNPTFNASFIHSIESIVLTDSNMMGTVSFTGDVTGGNAGGLTVDASRLTIATAFDFSSATSAIYHITGGSDNDSFKFAGNFTNSDRLDGGAGQDTLDINGSSLFSVNFDPDTIKNVETITLNGSGSVFLTMNDGNVAAGKSLTVTTVSSSVDLSFDGSAETDGTFTVVGGTQVDNIKGGHGDDTLSGGGGGDSLTGGAGADTFLYTAVSESTNKLFDGITDFAAGTDKIDTTVTVLGFGSIEHHSVDFATFNQDLQAAGAGDDQLHPSWAHIVHADSGDFAGHDFLIIDANGTGQYEAGFDYVIDITGYTGTVTAGDFI